jgi:hypothetical protein
MELGDVLLWLFTLSHDIFSLLYPPSEPINTIHLPQAPHQNYTLAQIPAPPPGLQHEPHFLKHYVPVLSLRR